MTGKKETSPGDMLAVMISTHMTPSLISLSFLMTLFDLFKIKF